MAPRGPGRGHGPGFLGQRCCTISAPGSSLLGSFLPCTSVHTFRGAGACRARDCPPPSVHPALCGGSWHPLRAKPGAALWLLQGRTVLLQNSHESCCGGHAHSAHEGRPCEAAAPPLSEQQRPRAQGGTGPGVSRRGPGPHCKACLRPWAGPTPQSPQTDPGKVWVSSGPRGTFAGEPPALPLGADLLGALRVWPGLGEALQTRWCPPPGQSWARKGAPEPILWCAASESPD